MLFFPQEEHRRDAGGTQMRALEFAPAYVS